MRQEDHDYELARVRRAHGRAVDFYRSALQRVELATFGDRIGEAEEIAKLARRAMFVWTPLPIVFDAYAGRPELAELIQTLHTHLASAIGVEQLTVAAPFALAVCSPNRPQNPDRAWFWLDHIRAAHQRDRLMSLMMSARPERKVRGTVVERTERGVFVAYVMLDK